MAFTEKQLQVINSRGGNLLVSASAGSGKTTVMIERILSLINEGVSISNMLICTFTKASASDMRDKLATALLNRALEGDKKAESQLTLLATSDISTIHSWCQRIIRKYFYEIGVDPSFEILDESETAVMLEEAMELAIAEKVEAQDEEFLLFNEVMKSGRSDTPIKNLIRYVYNFMEAQAEPEKVLSIEGDIQKKKAIIDDIVKSEGQRISKRFEKLIVRMIDYCNAEKFNIILPYLYDLLAKARGEHFEGVRLPSKVSEEHKELKEECKRLKSLFDDATKGIMEYYDLPEVKELPQFTETLLHLVKRTKDFYDEAKKKRGKLDYSDLEHYTCMLLQSPQIRQEVTEEYRYVFVDEYQDVNPLQERVLSALTGSAYFLVGDVKQSIYAFRMCDPNIFLDKQRNYEQIGYEKPIELNANFRSQKGVLDFTNLVMSNLMTDGFGRVNYARDAMLTSGREEMNAEMRKCVFPKIIVANKQEFAFKGVYSVEKSESALSVSREEAEANIVVRDIVERLKTPKADGTPVKQSDIAVLFASRSKLTSLIYRKLKKVGLSVSMCDRDKFSSVYEVSVLCSFMKYLTDFTDDISLVAVLRSPLVKLSDGELAQIRLSAPRSEKRFYEVCRLYASEKSDEIAKKINGLFALRDKYLNMTYSHSAGEIVGSLVAEKRWFMQAFSSEDAKIKADALNAFLEHLASLPQAKSVREYVEYLKRGNADFVPPPSGDSVRMMTIHASKGLEFPYVFLVGTAKQFSMRDLNGVAICDDELGVCLRTHNIDDLERQANKFTFASSIKLKRKLLEENIRKLYVALTRAKESVNIYATIKENDKFFSNETFVDYESERSFYGWMRDAIKYTDYELVFPHDYEEVKAEEIKSATTKKVDEKLVDEFKKYALAEQKYALTYGKEVKRVKSSVTAMMEEREEEKNVHYIAGADDDRALRKGNAYHKAMELIDFYAPFESEWERISREGEIALFVDKDKLKTAVLRVGELARGAKLYREKQFMLSENGKLVQGVIDLMIVKGDECIIVDYKTSTPARIDSGVYDLQLAMYARATSKILGLKVEKACIYSFERGEFSFLAQSGFNLQDIFND